MSSVSVETGKGSQYYRGPRKVLGVVGDAECDPKNLGDYKILDRRNTRDDPYGSLLPEEEKGYVCLIQLLTFKELRSTKKVITKSS